MLRNLLTMAALAAALPAAAQEAAGAAQAPATETVDFTASTLTYDENSDTVIAEGDVEVRRDGAQLTADRVVWRRKTNEVEAQGRVLLIDADGNRATGDRVQVTDTLKDGVVENILLVLSDGGRLAALRATRENGVTTLERGIYSPCAVVDANGCPLEPSWTIRAARVVHDPVRNRVSYRNAELNIFGIPVVGLPSLSHPDNFDRNRSGLISPDVRYNRILGAELTLPYYISFAPDRDLTLTPYLYTGVNPVLGANYRQLFAGGPIEVGGRITWARGERLAADGVSFEQTGYRVRGYFEARGRFEHGNGWRSTVFSRLASDDNFLGRYQISYDDRLRSGYNLEHFGADSYFTVQGWAFQGLRPTDRAGFTPFALPLIDFRWRPDVDLFGGSLLVQANALNLYRSEGQSYTRALASARWDRTLLTDLGQRVTFTALLRGDLYSARSTDEADDPFYAGRPGLRGRIIPLVAADVEWPFAGPLLGGTQVLTPRVQFVASRSSANLSIPNEDSRSIDLEDTNLWSFNRFPGYDRWEGGARVTYGADWTWSRPRISVAAQIGQSYRLSSEPGLYPEGTGLADRFSDIVGRYTIRFGQLLALTQRLRLDKSDLAVRRNELDVTVGTARTYATVGYLRFDRNIALEDLRDHEEVRVSGRVAFARYWALFGSTIIDLTNTRDDPFTTAGGFQPIRHRVGVIYRDDCLEISGSWRRDYVDNISVRRGDSFLFSLSLKNLGV